jgi:branched-chain amino acid aminotransferase
MSLFKEKLTEDDLQKKPDFSNLVFGKHYTDRMFIMNYSPDEGWHNAKISKFRNLELSPATLVLHYSQEIFEGLKAYQSADGKINLFRPLENFKRFNESAKRMCMPTIDSDFVLQSLKELLSEEKGWIPNEKGASLYIRPTMIGIDPFIGLKPSENYLFYIILCPVGAYYQTTDCLKILIEDNYVRAAIGGTGAAKTGGNYSASLLVSEKAKASGHSQVLWLDAAHHKYIEEVGAMNIFFVYGKKNIIVTPKLTGSILPGITRKSTIELLRSWDINVEEASLNIDQILSDIDSGEITESFGTGTAATISPVGSYTLGKKDHIINNQEAGPISIKTFETLSRIQYGLSDDPFNWISKF